MENMVIYLGIFILLLAPFSPGGRECDEVLVVVLLPGRVADVDAVVVVAAHGRQERAELATPGLLRMAKQILIKGIFRMTCDQRDELYACDWNFALISNWIERDYRD